MTGAVTILLGWPIDGQDVMAVKCYGNPYELFGQPNTLVDEGHKEIEGSLPPFLSGVCG